MKFKRIQPYRDVFIAELHMDRPLRVLDDRDGKTGGGIAVHVAYYIVDDFGEVLHPINAYFISPIIAQAAADILLDSPKSSTRRFRPCCAPRKISLRSSDHE